MRPGGRADDADRHVRGDASQQVPRRRAQAEDDGPARVRRHHAVVLHHRRDDVAVPSPSRRTSRPGTLPAGHAVGRRRRRRSRRAARCRPRAATAAARAVNRPPQAVAGADRLQLGRAGGQHDLVGVEVHELDGRASDRRTMSVGPVSRTIDLVAGGGVEHDHVPTGGLGCGCRGPAAGAGADDDDVRVVVDGIGLGCPWAAAGRRSAHGRVTTHHHPGPGRRLAGADVGHAVDLGHAAPAVAGQAQGAAVAGVLPGPQDGQGDGVAVGDRDRPAIQLQGRQRSRPHPQALRVEHRLGLQAGRAAMADDLDLEPATHRSVPGAASSTGT